MYPLERTSERLFDLACLRYVRPGKQARNRSTLLWTNKNHVVPRQLLYCRVSGEPWIFKHHCVLSSFEIKSFKLDPSFNEENLTRFEALPQIGLVWFWRSYPSEKRAKLTHFLVEPKDRTDQPRHSALFCCEKGGNSQAMITFQVYLIPHRGFQETF